MCGIFCLITKQKNFDFNLQSISSLYKRGPDDSGVITFKDNSAQFHFIQTRLLINGISSKLPIQDDKAILLVNGEIYNYKQLESMLKVKCKMSDCEILLHLYHHLKFQGKLNSFNEYIDGQYSFVIYDKESHRLFASRDQIGINSMYIGYSDNTIMISSDLKSITRQNILNLNIQHFKPYETLDLLLTLSDWSNLTFYKKDIYNPEMVINDTKKDAENNINLLLNQSVIKRVDDLLENNVEFGVLLSGGLDSSLVAGLVLLTAKTYNQHNYRKIKTFSIGINESAPDIIAARQVARYIGSDHKEYFMTKQEIIDNVENIINITETYDTTTIRASTAMYLLISKIKKDNPQLKVLFSGELSDELFCYLYGYNAPSSQAFQNETVKLVSNVYQYDALRANKTAMENGIEIRLPFTDKAFVKYILHLNPNLKEFNKTNGRMEKQLLRDAFNYSKIIPKTILYRKKEQFSDGVSCYNKEDNMIDILKEYALKNVIRSQAYICKLRAPHYSDGKEVKGKVSSEQVYYKQVFTRLFPNCSHLVEIWKPNWSTFSDPSGRVQAFWNKN